MEAMSFCLRYSLLILQVNITYKLLSWYLWIFSCLISIFFCSEFEVLEAAPTSAVIEEPLEPSFPIHAHTEVPEDSSSFMNFFNVSIQFRIKIHISI